MTSQSPLGGWQRRGLPRGVASVLARLRHARLQWVQLRLTHMRTAGASKLTGSVQHNVFALLQGMETSLLAEPVWAPDARQLWVNRAYSIPRRKRNEL